MKADPMRWVAPPARILRTTGWTSIWYDIARRRLFGYFLATQKVGDNMGRHAAELFSKLYLMDRAFKREYLFKGTA